MTSGMSRPGRGPSPSTTARSHVLSAHLLLSKVAKCSSRRRSGRRAHVHIWQGGLIAAVGARLHWSIHRNAQLLLSLHLLLRELESIGMRRQASHAWLTLHASLLLEVYILHLLLLRWQDTHIYILLMYTSDMLLLLLKLFYLLL